MNCPGHMLLFGSRPRSYKELPLRYSEAASLHRDELPGTLHGLLRVRIVTQDDAHIFCTEEQIQDEIASCVEQARYLYELFGLKASAYELSLEIGRPMLDELNRPLAMYGSTECSTCRLQMEEGTGKRTLHPAQYLALAYGLLPEVFERLKQPIPELVLQ